MGCERMHCLRECYRMYSFSAFVMSWTGTTNPNPKQKQAGGKNVEKCTEGQRYIYIYDLGFVVYDIESCSRLKLSRRHRTKRNLEHFFICSKQQRTNEEMKNKAEWGRHPWVWSSECIRIYVIWKWWHTISPCQFRVNLLRRDGLPQLDSVATRIPERKNSILVQWQTTDGDTLRNVIHVVSFVLKREKYGSYEVQMQ